MAPRPHSVQKSDIWDGYVEAITSERLAPKFEAYGITNRLRLCHLMATWVHECGAFTILWEEMYYTSVRAVRNAWNSRAAGVTDQWISENLLRNPRGLAEWAYHGRMGNRIGTTDAFDCRGFGIQQITGRTDHDRLLQGHYSYDSAVISALIEWKEKGCNELADDDDARTIRKRINGGFNGMASVDALLKRAKAIWTDDSGTDDGATSVADAGTPEPAARETFSDVSHETFRETSAADLRPQSRKLGMIAQVRTWLASIGIGTGGLTLADAGDLGGENVQSIMAFVKDHGILILIVGCVMGIGLAYLFEHYVLEDYRDGRYRPSGG